MTEQSRERRVGRDMGTSQNQPQDESSMITKIFTSFQEYIHLKIMRLEDV